MTAKQASRNIWGIVALGCLAIGVFAYLTRG